MGCIFELLSLLQCLYPTFTQSNDKPVLARAPCSIEKYQQIKANAPVLITKWVILLPIPRSLICLSIMYTGVNLLLALSFSKSGGVHDRLDPTHLSPVWYMLFPWHRHYIEMTNIIYTPVTPEARCHCGACTA